VRAVGIEGQHILAARLLEAGAVGVAETRKLLAHEPGIVLANDLLGAIGRPAVHDDDLAGRSQGC